METGGFRLEKKKRRLCGEGETTAVARLFRRFLLAEGRVSQSRGRLKSLRMMMERQRYSGHKSRSSKSG